MKPGKLNIDLYQFASFTLPLQWRDGLGAPVDLTGYKARLQVRERATSTQAALSLDSGTLGGVSIENAQEGRIRVSITDEQTGAMTIRAGFYDIVIESPAGDAVRLLEGTVTVHAGITKPGVA